MKGLKKIALASAIAAVSAGAQAELKALDDATMGELTGQAGLTIDVETKLTLGEFMYKDAGSVVIQNIVLQGSQSAEEQAVMGSSYLDNFRLTLDIAGDGSTGGPLAPDNVLNYGFSEIRSLVSLTVIAGNLEGEMVQALTGVDPNRVDANGNALAIDIKRTFGDGDLVIHSGFTDPWQKGGGFAAYANGTGNIDWAEAVANGAAGGGSAGFTSYSYDQSETIVSKSVDFNFGFEVLGLTASAYEAGDAAATALGTLEKTDHATGLDADTTTTTLISDLSINGYFGPSDFVITNRGNGFESTNTAGDVAWGDADSKIYYSRFISITDLDVYIDIAGVAIKDLQIHNRRGDQSSLFDNGAVTAANFSGLNRWAPNDGTNNSAHGFAHTMRDIYAVKDNIFSLGKTVPVAALVQLGGGDVPGAIATAAGTTWGQYMNGTNAGNSLNDTAAADRDAFYRDGIVLDTSFKGDIDIPHLSFGDDNLSIGEIYLTDLEVHRIMTISAH